MFAYAELEEAVRRMDIEAVGEFAVQLDRDGSPLAQFLGTQVHAMCRLLDERVASENVRLLHVSPDFGDDGPVYVTAVKARGRLPARYGLYRRSPLFSWLLYVVE